MRKSLLRRPFLEVMTETLSRLCEGVFVFGAKMNQLGRLPDLQEVVSFRNQSVIEKFKRDFPHLADSADHQFEELMKYLWLAKKHLNDQAAAPDDESLKFLFAIYDDLVNVDHMWHCFILSTHDYFSFCERFYGHYLHHIPDAMNELPPTKQELADDMGRFASYVYDNLGEGTVRTWFGV